MDTNGPDGPPFAVVHDIAATWDDYPVIRRVLTGAWVNGLILHAAGPTDDGFRTIDVWTSQDAWHRHRSSLDHILDQLHVPTAMREFQVDHLMTSPSMADTTMAANPRSNSREQ
jgi:hypothetical protein